MCRHISRAGSFSYVYLEQLSLDDRVLFPLCISHDSHPLVPSREVHSRFCFLRFLWHT